MFFCPPSTPICLLLSVIMIIQMCLTHRGTCFPSETADVSLTAPCTGAAGGRSLWTNHLSRTCRLLKSAFLYKKRKERSLLRSGWTHKAFTCFLSWHYSIQADWSINLSPAVLRFNDLETYCKLKPAQWWNRSFLISIFILIIRTEQIWICIFIFNDCKLEMWLSTC